MLLRVLPLLIVLALSLAPSSQAAVFIAAPASIAPTPENASTAFLEDGPESRIGLLCAGDPVNRVDPYGLVSRQGPGLKPPPPLQNNAIQPGWSNAVGHGQGFSTQGWWSTPAGFPTNVGNGAGPSQGGRLGNGSSGGYVTTLSNAHLSNGVLTFDTTSTGWLGNTPSNLPVDNFGFRPGDISTNRSSSWEPFYRFLNTPATPAQKAWTDTARTPTLVAAAILTAPLWAPEAVTFMRPAT